MIDDIIDDLERIGWEMDPHSGLVGYKKGMGCHMRVQDSLVNAIWRIVESRWKDRAYGAESDRFVACSCWGCTDKDGGKCSDE